MGPEYVKEVVGRLWTYRLPAGGVTQARALGAREEEEEEEIVK